MDVHRTIILQGVNEHAPGALAAGASHSVATKLDASQQQGIWIRKVKAAMSFTTKSAGEGPLSAGFSQGLSGAEINEAIGADPQGMGDELATSQANRHVVPLWYVGNDGTGSSEFVVRIETIPDFPRWKVRENVSLSTYVFNHDSTALTNLNMRIFWWLLGEWIDD